jgi:hypothetical protein
VIQTRHLLASSADTRASVSQKDLATYMLAYQDFLAPKGKGQQKKPPIKARETLA